MVRGSVHGPGPSVDRRSVARPGARWSLSWAATLVLILSTAVPVGGGSQPSADAPSADHITDVASGHGCGGGTKSIGVRAETTKSTGGTGATTTVSAAIARGPRSARTAAKAKREWVGGVDVSHWNGIVPFDKVRAAGMAFAFMKATQGTTFVDDTFGRQFANARAAGIVAGGYHFYDYRVDGAPQAGHFLRVLEEAGALEDDALPPVVDLECFPPFGRADQAYVRQELRAFVETIQERIGRSPILYTSGHMWNQLTGGDSSFGALPLWVACWDCASPGLPAGWDRWLFWQVGAVRIPGMDAKIGEDRFVGDIDDLVALTGRAAFIVRATTKVTSQRDVSVRFKGLQADEVRVSVDERSWGKWRSWTGSVRVRLPDRDGKHTIRVQTRKGGTLGSVFRHTLRLDRTPPRIGSVQPGFVVGAVGGDSARRRIEVAVKAKGLGDGKVRVIARCGEEVVEVPVAGADPSRDRRGLVPLDRSCRLSAVATDPAGNASAWVAPSTIQLTEVTAAPSARLAYGAGWTRVSEQRGTARSAWASSDAGSTATLRFSGISIAVVARRGPGAGTLIVSLDGQRRVRVDLGADRRSAPRVVATLQVGGRVDREHELEIRVGHDKGSPAGHVEIEGFLIAHSSPS